jgi:peptide/nickel transport system substrate-binding protein
VNLRNIRHRSLAVIGAAVLALAAAACGSSSNSSSGGSAPSIASVAGPTTGPGLTEPTTGTGSKVTGGTVYFGESSQAPPNYIFPMYNFQVCSTTNANQLMINMWRGLYFYGQNYVPSVNYSKSIGEQPTYSNGGKTVTIKLKSWKWTDGEAVTARDLVFWMNVLKASPSTEWCGYAPGYFPDNVTSYSAPDPSTFVITFNKAYDPEWILNSELSQIFPLPLAWDRTSLSGCGTMCKAPSNTANLPDSTKSGAAAVYKFLDGESKKLGSWATSPLWNVVDGPYKLTAFDTSGRVTMVPNPDYSGTPKATVTVVELPFTSEAAIYNQVKSGGPSSLSVTGLPSQYAPQLSSLGSSGYNVNKAASYSFNYFPLNLNSSAPTSPGGEPVRDIFRQTYFRNALQHLVDQNGWIHAFLYNTAIPTCGPIPFAPPSPLVNTSAIGTAPCSFSPSTAQQLLTSHGWKVVANGTTTCDNPSLCGTGIQKGEGISFNIDYQSGVVAVQNEMNDLASQAKKLGITISLTAHPFSTVVATGAPCTPSQASCKWTAENWGAGWIYGPSYLPTGEQLYNPGSAANAGSYNDPKATQLITATIEGPASQENQALTNYAKYIGEQDPVIFGPTSVGTFGGVAATLVDKKLGGYTANALGFMSPEDWYFTK